MLEGLKWKVTKYEHATFNELEMADDKRLGGARGAPPPAFLGLKILIGGLQKGGAQPLPQRALKLYDVQVWSKNLKI